MRYFRKNRENSVKAKAAEELIIQARIEKEINSLKHEHEKALAMAVLVADAEKRLAEQPVREREALERHVIELQRTMQQKDARLADLSTRQTDLVDFNLNLQGQVSDLKTDVQKNRERILELENGRK